MAENVKEKKKHKGLKVLGVIILIIALIVGIGFGVIYYLTKPVDDSSDKAIYVGGMRSSQSIDYKSDSSKGLENDIIVKIMQVSWKFLDSVIITLWELTQFIIKGSVYVGHNQPIFKCFLHIFSPTNSKTK